jgi:hypothetical protein
MSSSGELIPNTFERVGRGKFIYSFVIVTFFIIATKKITERHPERKRRISSLSQNSKGKTQKLNGFDF